MTEIIYRLSEDLRRRIKSTTGIEVNAVRVSTPHDFVEGLKQLLLLQYPNQEQATNGMRTPDWTVSR